MAGRRLLDAARLIDASLSVAKHHVAQRQQQWDVYSQTSSLAKAVRAQTDRVTVTVGAAYELSKRFAESGPSWEQTQDAEPNDGPREEWNDKRRETAQHQSESENSRHAVRQEPRFEADDSWNRTGEIRATPSTPYRPEREGSQNSARSSHGQLSNEPNAGRESFNSMPTAGPTEPTPARQTAPPSHPEDPQILQKRMNEASTNGNISFTSTKNGSPVLSPDEDTQESWEAVNSAVSSYPRVSRILGSGRVGGPKAYAGRKKMPPQPLPEMMAASERWQKERQSSSAEETPETPPSMAPEPSGTDIRIEEPAVPTAHESDACSFQSIRHRHVNANSHLQTKSAERINSSDQPASNFQYEMRESRVPSSRFGRLWQYGGLATSMALGAVGERFRRAGGGSAEGSLMLSEGNMDRLVKKLSRMRGAALKLGQILSFQDSKILPPAINAVLQRVQDSADYMPPSQRNKVLTRSLGSEWRNLFSKFEERPFAAASIGQVHKAILKSNGQDVAVKVQYPGVRDSIDSDLNNLSLLLTASRLLPRGLFLENTIANARTELGWECDYEREAAAGKRFKNELLSDESDIFAAPTVYAEASGPEVLTAEFMTGTAVTKLKDISQDERDWIGTHILRLCWRELIEWRFMQTDPNWTNFLFNQSSQKIELLDFGASRDFPDKFVTPYVELLIAASKGDRQTCHERSIELGYLTGHESKEMLNAHIDSIMTLAEPFMESAPDVYDFEDQTITNRVRANIGLMLRERLAPPPEETYSLHRKLSGAFLLCARLKSKIRTKEMFQHAVNVWNSRKGTIYADP